MEYPQKVTINVTQEDIDKATPRSCSACPIALAFMRVFPEHEAFIYTMPPQAIISPNIPHESTSYNIPEEAREFIKKYDHNIPVKPFEFEAFLQRRY